ncbi:MAG: hypothetical protein HY235_03165 [Acidobacteria bacterium]|nr:hypothetical protein [Acidobacteriota bacterium]
METTDAVVSELAPMAAVLAEIHYCSGVAQTECPAVLDALKSTIKDLFVENQAAAVILRGIGTFTPVVLEEARYRLTVEDPIRVHEFSGPRFFPTSV